MKKITTIAISFIILICGSAFAQNLKDVTVTIAPEAYVVKKIAGDKVKVNTIVKGNLDPHNYEPKVSDIRSLSNTRIYFTIGYPFEKTLIEKVKENYKNISFVNVADGIPYAEEHTHDHDHDSEDHDHDAEGHEHHAEEHDHDELGLDPHYWTDPSNMIIISENIYNALVIAYPEHKNDFTKNYNKLLAEIKAIDSKFKKLFEKESNITFMVYHPSFGYFAKNYGITQLTIEKEGKTPTPKHIKDVLTEAKKLKTKFFIVQPEDNPEIVKVVTKDLKLNQVKINIMSESWDNMMNELYKAFQSSINN